ncbi:hypothetical protein P389DRAFT_166146 [Cystobasidium minutum MCA 4210]|uniref:uncharacterized protein n=1 Tax=Cystobasidium minutum MCA 4210 TaxID=1397322 RepID=UPI0034CD4DB8|eukprot:jgi/Rhomi1/166146/fgenesh1_kg.1_\
MTSAAQQQQTGPQELAFKRYRERQEEEAVKRRPEWEREQQQWEEQQRRKGEEGSSAVTRAPSQTGSRAPARVAGAGDVEHHQQKQQQSPATPRAERGKEAGMRFSGSRQGRI